MEPVQELNHDANHEPHYKSVSHIFKNGFIPRLRFRQAVGQCVSRYATFKGRARRSEFWFFGLFGVLAVAVPLLPVCVLGILDERAVIDLESEQWIAAGTLSMFLALIGLFAFLVLLIPTLSVQTRRLHDVGLSGWWVVLSLAVGIVAGIVPFIIFGPTSLEMNEIELFVLAFRVSKFAGASLLTACAVDYALFFTLLVFSVFDSDKGINKYGPSPKYMCE